jgi:putative ABC transport system ATP-binding protein
MDALIATRGLGRRFELGDREVDALRDVSFEIHPGEFVAVTGPSGSGKSTLLHILGALERPTSGSYRFDGCEIAELDDRALAQVRSRHIGFVFQAFHLLPELDVLENVALPFLYARQREARAHARAAEALASVGMSHRASHPPSRLSGGEMQRVAIARALVMQPRLILADEPTGNLDSGTGTGILRLLEELNARGITLVMVTHDESIASRASHRVRMKDGRVAIH